MDERGWLAERFEEHRPHVKAVAYRMLGSLTEADDAVQESWLRLNRSEVDGVENLGGWLTTIVARVCLNTLRSRKVRGEESMDVHVPGRPGSFAVHRRWLDGRWVVHAGAPRSGCGRRSSTVLLASS